MDACEAVRVTGLGRQQEATGGARREVFQRSSGTFKDCWAAKEDLVAGTYAGFCDDVTMVKVMVWDFE